jgi:hypothetical protein
MLRSRIPRRSESANERPIDGITIGVRHRRDLGNIDDMAADIAEVGLLHPIVVTSKNVLIAGADAFKVLEAWGCEHKTILTWVKDRIGTGDWLRGQTHARPYWRIEWIYSKLGTSAKGIMKIGVTP